MKQAKRGDAVVTHRWWHVRGFAAAGFAAVACAVVATPSVGPPSATAAPPPNDERGFVDSTARCAAPSKAIGYGYTANSRVAICKDDATGQYQYRGVRVSDGARLILAARLTDGGYVAENDGITYTVTSTALTISSGSQQIRREPMIEFAGSAPSGTSSTSTSTTSSPTTGSTQSSAIPETVTPTTPLPPPLPAEAGHS
ncbi:hypothetical protein TUM20985_45560 [Mycobacterium antarcticum]|nr:hypothetical protein TUM20985_45560 [Mycolicibacterium sp. TUM20985]GLP82398.1 hypothetical protein TUM20984_38180 [Mycolicibacterium sp. TUM20984]